MKIILNESLTLPIDRGVNIYITDNHVCRNLFLSSFSTWFKTGINTVEDANFEIYVDGEKKKKSEFELVTISPTIEDYLKSRSTKNSISNQLYEMSVKDVEISNNLSEISKSIIELTHLVNRSIPNKFAYEFSSPDNIDKQLVSLLDFNLKDQSGLAHDILESKIILLDLLISNSSKKELIIFLPYFSLSLTNEEIAKFLVKLESISAYIVIIDNNFDIICSSSESSSIRFLKDANTIIDINEMINEVKLFSDNSEVSIAKSISIVTRHYSEDILTDIDLINDYLANKFMI